MTGNILQVAMAHFALYTSLSAWIKILNIQVSIEFYSVLYLKKMDQHF